jgi:hypothetical protein
MAFLPDLMMTIRIYYRAPGARLPALYLEQDSP